MNNHLNSRLLQIALKVLIWVGVACCFVGISADCLGLGQQPGFGGKQILLLAFGAGLAIVNWLFLWLLRTGSYRIGPYFWPSIRSAIIILFLSALVVAVDIHFSSQLGLLAHPPTYDGVAYVLAAKSSFYALHAGGLNPAALFQVLHGYFTFAPLWKGLMLMSFWVLCEGEWQAYTVRFWPTVLLLLLMFWVVRRRGCVCVAWVALLFTALLPTISVSLRSAIWEYFTGTSAFQLGWSLADLRPDLLFAVLLLWTVVPLIERADNLDRPTWLVSGTAAALAILTKSSATPVLLLAGGLTVTYVLVANRGRLAGAMMTAVWGIVPFAILLTPWVLVGGPRVTVTYIYHHLTVGRPLWSNPNATFLSEATLYWRFFPYHMGHWESWLFLGVGLVLWLARVWQRRDQRGSRLLPYLLLAGALYGLVSATPNKNLFIGLPYYLLLWFFSWAALAPVLTAIIQRSRIAHICLILFATLYGGVILGVASYALGQWPVEKQLWPKENRVVTERIAGDLRGILNNDDTFMWVPVYGYPAALQYYMMDNQGRFPQAAWVDPTSSPPIPQFLQESASPCKAVLVFEQDIEEVGKYFPNYPLSYPYWRAISDWVRRPESSYRLVRTYRMWGQSPDRPVVLHLYVKEFDESLEDSKN